LKIKIFEWLKKHIIITIVILILLIWVIEKLYPLIVAKLSSHSQIMYVETLVVKAKPGSQSWQSIGTVKAVQEVMVSSEVSGVIQSLAVNNGQLVNEGQVILNIRHADISANLEKDQAILTEKQLYYARLQRLFKTKTVSEETMTEALSSLQQAQASVNADQALLDKYIIKASFSGEIGIWQVDPGQLVQLGDPLVTLTNLSAVYIDFMLPAKALNSIKVGDSIVFTTTSLGNFKWQGQIIAIDPQLDTATRSIQLRAAVQNQDKKLVPRLYGEVTIVKILPPQLSIPQESVIYDPEGASVFILQKNIATKRQITLGMHIDDDVVVKTGLRSGDEVVTAGMMKLFPGVQVSVNKKVMQR